MLAGAVATQQPQQGAAGHTLLPLAAAAGGLPAVAAGVHSNQSTGACPAVFVANIGHIGSDRDLKDLFNRFVGLQPERLKLLSAVGSKKAIFHLTAQIKKRHRCRSKLIAAELR